MDSRLAIVSILLPLTYVLCLPILSEWEVGTITQQNCSYTVHRAFSRTWAVENGFPKKAFSISGFMSSPAAPGVFASLCAPAMCILYAYPIAVRSMLQDVLLYLVYTLWVLFLATPIMANEIEHDVIVSMMFGVFQLYLILQYVTLRKRDLRDPPAEVALVVTFLGLLGSVITAVIDDALTYPFEVTAFIGAFSFTPLLHLYRNHAPSIACSFGLAEVA